MKGLISSISALFSSACCVGPVVLTGMGVGASTAGFLGGMAGFVKALMPFKSLFIAGALVVLALNFYTVYGPKRKACLEGSIDGEKKLKREKMLLWANTVAVILFILSPYLLAI
ncbi:hypothetical protein MNBD_NITROSPIRAE01-435 [hydrothermal vent metagenome]|uniref:Mercuric transport protein, MerT n=1 Tax=hydrothermal vent metagenome TaxID=652676 RepID=A0A3B1D8L3_9ZZZZ